MFSLHTLPQAIRVEKTVKCHRKGGGVRRAIGAFSKRARFNLRWVTFNTDWKPDCLITLTYKGVMTDGALAKKHLNQFLTEARKNEMFRQYLWFAEFQRRGSLHFHLAVKCSDNVNNSIDLLKSWVADTWVRIIGLSSDYSAHTFGTDCRPIDKPHALRLYAFKYAEKAEQKDLPDGVCSIGRWWGRAFRNRFSC
jgi:hypothetical protein